MGCGLIFAKKICRNFYFHRKKKLASEAHVCSSSIISNEKLHYFLLFHSLCWQTIHWDFSICFFFLARVLLFIFSASFLYSRIRSMLSIALCLWIFEGSMHCHNAVDQSHILFFKKLIETKYTWAHFIVFTVLFSHNINRFYWKKWEHVEGKMSKIQNISESRTLQNGKMFYICKIMLHVNFVTTWHWRGINFKNRSSFNWV